MKIPLAYIPTEVVLLDDDTNFLTSIRGSLTDNYFYSLFSVPEEALTHIKNAQDSSKRWNCLEEVIENTGYTSFATRYDFSCIHKEIYSPTRFNEISVVIVDYAMPQMNGLEFLSRIKNKNIKKILLTGEADERIAVDAFNRGLIHKYIKKMSPLFQAELRATIYQFTQDFWRERTTVPSQVLDANYQSLPFGCPDVEQFFQVTLHQYDIKEYYLLEGSFRFLLVDEQGKTYTLWIQSKAEADALSYEFEACEGTNISQKLKAEIYAYKKILCVPLKNGVMLNTSEWHQHYRDAQKIGTSDFFAVLETGSDLEYPILSFESAKVLRLPKTKSEAFKALEAL